MDGKDLLSRLGKYLKGIAASGEFDDFFSTAIGKHYKNIVYHAIRTSHHVKDDADDVIQCLIIGLWEAMSGFCDTHFTYNGNVYTLHSKTDKGWYLRYNREVHLIDEKDLESVSYPVYLSIFFKQMKQVCSAYVNRASCEKRGLKADHLYISDTNYTEDGYLYTLEESLDSFVESPEACFEFEETKQLIYEELSDYAQIYFNAVSMLPSGPIEGWSKPLRLYKRELLQARAELYRTYNKRIKGIDLEFITDEIVKGLKDPFGPVMHKPVHISAGALKR